MWEPPQKKDFKTKEVFSVTPPKKKLTTFQHHKIEALARKFKRRSFRPGCFKQTTCLLYVPRPYQLAFLKLWKEVEEFELDKDAEVKGWRSFMGVFRTQ